MLGTISIIVFLVVLGCVSVHCIVSALGEGYQWRPISILKTLVHLVTLIFIEQKHSLVGVLRKLVYLVGLFCFLVLALTGFWPVIFGGRHLSGYLLMIHATFAPVFAVCVAVLSVMWADNCQFDKNYWPWLQRILQRQAVSKSKPGRYEFLRKICFWLILVLMIPLILSIVLSMFPLFGTAGQKFLLAAHGYSALTFAVVVILHTYLVIKAGME